MAFVAIVRTRAPGSPLPAKGARRTAPSRSRMLSIRVPISFLLESCVESGVDSHVLDLAVLGLEPVLVVPPVRDSFPVELVEGHARGGGGLRPRELELGGPNEHAPD